MFSNQLLNRELYTSKDQEKWEKSDKMWPILRFPEREEKSFTRQDPSTTKNTTAATQLGKSLTRPQPNTWADLDIYSFCFTFLNIDLNIEMGTQTQTDKK